jgi:hypothetical protein
MEFYLPFFKYPDRTDFALVKSWKVIDPAGWLRTGDILLFSGSSFMSSTIKLVTSSKWNHVGMACWCELTYYDGKTTIDLFSFEMGSQKFTDLMTKQPTAMGTRIVRLGDIASMYDIISVRRLNRKNRYSTNVPVDGDEWAAKFEKYARKWSQVPYIGFNSLVKTYLFRSESPIGQTTCTHVATKMMDYMGVYPLDFDPAQVYPEDFTKAALVFPKDIFDGPDTIVYRDSGKINARLIFLISVIIIIIIVFFALYLKSLGSRSARYSLRS